LRATNHARLRSSDANGRDELRRGLAEALREFSARRRELRTTAAPV